MSATLIGDKKLLRQIRRLTEEARGAALADAVLAGAEPIRVEAGHLAPRRPGGGELSRNIGKELTDKKTATSREAAVGPKKEVWYGIIVELGHDITDTAKGKRRRKGTKILGRVPPKPYLRPAFDSRRDAAVTAMAVELRQAINRAIAL